jgi:hypothetical protein
MRQHACLGDLAYHVRIWLTPGVYINVTMICMYLPTPRSHEAFMLACQGVEEVEGVFPAWLSIPSGFLVVFETRNRRSCTLTLLLVFA